MNVDRLKPYAKAWVGLLTAAVAALVPDAYQPLALAAIPLAVFYIPNAPDE